MRNRFHSLCPYFAMFPEAFVEAWVSRLTKPRDVVYDPFCGRGTAPFQALLMNRRAIGNDINAVAYCVTKAKTNAPDLEHVEQRLDLLEAGFDMARWEDAASSHPEFFSYAFAPETFKQLLYLRDSLHWSASDLDCMIAAVVLGILHGDVKSRSYLSNQMPRTISTKPSYSIRYWKLHELRAPVRDVFSLVRQKLLYRYQDRLPPERATIFHGDMRNLPRQKDEMPGPIRFAITSPPYLDTTSFEEDQWLRLWFLG